MKNTKDLIAQAQAANQQQLHIPSQDVLIAQKKKCEKLRIKKVSAEETAVKKLEIFLAKPIVPEKPLNRPQYIMARTLGFINDPMAEVIAPFVVGLPCFLITRDAATGFGLFVMTCASIHVLSNKYLPRLMTRAQAVDDIIPILDNLSTSDNPNVQKCVEKLAEKLNDQNISSTFWSKCYDILLPVNTAVCQFNEQNQQVASFVSIERKTTENSTEFATDPKRMKL